MSERVLLSGNEAIARGAYEAGVRVATAYPGTPSTEILESIVKYKDDIYCEWAPNEKVAVEVGQGASFGGARTITAMKHVGVNVAGGVGVMVGVAVGVHVAIPAGFGVGVGVFVATTAIFLGSGGKGLKGR